MPSVRAAPRGARCSFVRTVRISVGGLSVVGALLGALGLATGAASWACVAGARLSIEPESAQVGESVAVRGRLFNTDPTVPGVQVRFNGRTGQLLWEGRPDEAGQLNFSFGVPSAAPGYYFLIAYQEDASGRPMPGTPARAPFEVVQPAADQPAAQVAVPERSEPAPAIQQATPVPAPIATALPGPAPRRPGAPSPHAVAAPQQVAAAAPSATVWLSQPSPQGAGMRPADPRALAARGRGPVDARSRDRALASVVVGSVLVLVAVGLVLRSPRRRPQWARVRR